MLLGEDATKACVLQGLSMTNYAHFAWHGHPDLGLMLAGESEAGGRLSMAEVQALKLPSLKLVVLATCDSFKDELHLGGVVGIARAFLAAGASTLLASLRKVGDAATHDLMALFYKQMLGEAAGDAAVALQHAMLSMLADKRGVQMWAGFSVYGLLFYDLGSTAGPAAL